MTLALHSFRCIARAALTAASAASGHAAAVIVLGAAEQRPDPAHPLGGRFWMVAELLRHPASAAIGAELLHGDPDRLRHSVGAWRIRSLQGGGEQRLAPGVVHGQLRGDELARPDECERRGPWSWVIRAPLPYVWSASVGTGEPVESFLSAGPCHASHSAHRADAVLARAAQLAGRRAPAIPMTRPARARSTSSAGLKTLT